MDLLSHRDPEAQRFGVFTLTEVNTPKRTIPDKELKLTATIYVTKPGAVEFVRGHGRLPDQTDTGGLRIAMRVIIERRGTDLKLTKREKLVYDALAAQKHFPGGRVRLVDPGD